MSEVGQKHRAEKKVRQIPLLAIHEPVVSGKKPSWIRARMPVGAEIDRVKKLLRKNRLVTVCEEASCPNLGECFNGGTATFMIMGDICTRRCSFCDVGFGRPRPLDKHEPAHLAQAIAELKLNYVVITSVDRDDLEDGGASHFASCITAVRASCPGIEIEILVPDFKNREQAAIHLLADAPPDYFNHNLETVPRLYKRVRPGAVYQGSLELLEKYKTLKAEVMTKSGLMLGLGETLDEVKAVMRDMRDHKVDMVTLGQYLQPSRAHHPVVRYVEPGEFEELAVYAKALGFSRVASGPMVRSSYHADEQAHGHKPVK
ncbi:MAG: lipoyl synthase [Pseudomonadales bacterium]|nr:lipoyl synthase [Pseudomonadales bacterium]